MNQGWMMPNGGGGPSFPPPPPPLPPPGVAPPGMYVFYGNNVGMQPGPQMMSPSVAMHPVPSLMTAPFPMPPQQQMHAPLLSQLVGPQIVVQQAAPPRIYTGGPPPYTSVVFPPAQPACGVTPLFAGTTNTSSSPVNNSTLQKGRGEYRPPLPAFPNTAVPCSPQPYKHETEKRPPLKPVEVDLRPQDLFLHTQTLDADAEVDRRFHDEYNAQEDEDAIVEHLREQAQSAMGTIGTLNVEECMRVISNNDVIFVITETGTGKSTLIPKELLDQNPENIVVNAQPRRTSAINLAHRVAKLLDEPVGKRVGYSLRGERIGELGETSLMYVTNYTLFLFFLWRKPEGAMPFTHIILDEFHERTPEVEVMLLLFKVMLLRYPQSFKLILCSATPDMEAWSSFFDGARVATYNQANSMHTIHDYYAEDMSKLLRAPYAPIEVASSNVVQSLQLHQVLSFVKRTLMFLASVASPAHSILVFIPGRTVVESLCKWIRTHFNEELDPIPWYSDIDLSVIQEAIQREPTTRKKVYVATDIAEMSLTLPDVVFIIDSGTTKRPRIDPSKKATVAFPPLELLWEGRMNAQQRRGRIGRVQQGFYFSMLSKEHHSTLLDDRNRCASATVMEVVLHSLQLCPSPHVLFSLCHDCPRLASIQYSLFTLGDGGYIVPPDHPDAAKHRFLLKRGCVSSELIQSDSRPWETFIEEERTREVAFRAAHSAESTTPHDPEFLGPTYLDKARESYDVTMKGYIVSCMPTSVLPATVVFLGMTMGIPVLSIIAAAVQATKSPFYIPYGIHDVVRRGEMEEEVRRHMKTYKGEIYSDVICSVGAVLEYMDMQRDGLSDDAQEQWCEERFLSRTRCVDVVNLVAQMKEQARAVLPFNYIEDIDVLRAQFEKEALLLKFLVCAAHLQWSVYVQHDAVHAQKYRHYGTGVFFPMKVMKEHYVPSLCPWDRHSICIPLSLRANGPILLASFSSQLRAEEYHLIVILFSHEVMADVTQHLTSATEPAGDPARPWNFFIRYMGITQCFMCDALTAQQILQLRRMQCAQLLVMQSSMESQSIPHSPRDLTDRHRAVMEEYDFGIPEAVQQRLPLIPALLQSGFRDLLLRFTAMDPSAICRCVPIHKIPPSVAAIRSTLVSFSNGISPLQPGEQLHNPEVAARKPPPPPDANDGDDDEDENVAKFVFE